MALGYVLTLEQTLAYYGEERPEIPNVLARAARGRVIRRADWADGEKGETMVLSSPADLPRQLRSQLENSGCRLHEVPSRYPALHAPVGQDIVLEVDNKENQRECFESGRQIMEFLDGFGAPYRVKFSGNCSTHVIIPEEAYQHLIPEEKRESIFKRLFEWLMSQLNDKASGWLDDSFVQQSHYLRLPYSLNERTGLVSLPIRPEAYDEFQLDKAQVDRVVVEEWWFDMDELRSKREGMIRLLKAGVGDAWE